MNISQLVKSFLGEVKGNNAHVVELKIGQIVNGIVLKMLSNKEAILQIGGASVRAELKTPLKEGEHTLLQVQPESVPGKIVFKPLEQSKVPIIASSFDPLIKSLDLKNRPEVHQLLKQLHDSEIPLNKETVKSFVDVMKKTPTHIPQKEIVQSAILAYKRGFPLTKNIVSSLHTVLFSKNSLLNKVNMLHQQLDQDVESLKNPDQTKNIALGFKKIVNDIKNDSKILLHSNNTVQHEETTDKENLVQIKNSDRTLTETNKQQEMKTAVSKDIVKGTPSNSKEILHTDMAKATQSSSASHKQMQAISKESTPKQAITNMIKSMGLDYEAQLVKQIKHNMVPMSNMISHHDTSANQLESNNQIHSMKSLLLQLLDQPQIADASKQAAHELIQHITGHQLLATPNQMNTLASATLFIPIMSEQGQQTASVHIQSRKGKQGKIDGENCRLLFDLQMKHMGDTWVDVQVVDRQVSIQINNDHPMIKELLKNNENEISQGIKELGYQLVSIKSNPFPEEKKDQTDNRITTHITSDTYKGVDIKI